MSDPNNPFGDNESHFLRKGANALQAGQNGPSPDEVEQEVRDKLAQKEGDKLAEKQADKTEKANEGRDLNRGSNMEQPSPATHQHTPQRETPQQQPNAFTTLLGEAAQKEISGIRAEISNFMKENELNTRQDSPQAQQQSESKSTRVQPPPSTPSPARDAENASPAKESRGRS